LPKMAAQSFSEVIVVDYGCTQGTAEWVRANYPGIRVIAVNDDPVFCVARARNLGSAQARGSTLLFVDADVHINGDLGSWIAEHAKDGSYYMPSLPMDLNLFGTVICGKTSFDKVGGYDEAYLGWGGEDKDFYTALDMQKVEWDTFPNTYLTAIRPPDAERQIGESKGGMDTMRQALRTNLAYRSIKYDIARVTSQVPDLQFRKTLMATVKAAVRKSDSAGDGQEQTIALALPLDDDQQELGIAKSLVYKLNPI
jgi:glycosyltransferase involved in cell wall biosynthesis